MFPSVGIASYFHQNVNQIWKSMLWSDSVHFTDPKYFIHGPFNYDAYGDIIQPNQNVALTHWEFLFYFCNQFSIVPPTLSTLIVNKSSRKKRKK